RSRRLRPAVDSWSGPTMHCGRCTAENDPAARFCRDCGAPLAQRCPACGHVNVGSARFCNQCGRELVATRAVPPVLEDERKQVTILFADVKASLELLADRD